MNPRLLSDEVDDQDLRGSQVQDQVISDLQHDLSEDLLDGIDFFEDAHGG